MWELLGKYGVDPETPWRRRGGDEDSQKFILGIMACVRNEGENAEAFDVKTGLRQGCILSRTLFNIALDYIINNEMGH